MPFTQKYTLIQLFENVPVGTQFSSNAWPLHSTVVDTFAIDWSVEVMIDELTNLLINHTNAVSTAMEDRFFGEDGLTKVTLLNKSDSLIKLHYSIIELLQNGGLKLNDPQYAREGFLPHATVQSHARLTAGDEVIFKALSVIDMFPNEDPYQRKVLATIKLSD